MNVCMYVCMYVCTHTPFAMEVMLDEFMLWDLLDAAGTPYENGIFRMKLLLSHDFPQSPPKGLSL